MNRLLLIIIGGVCGIIFLFSIGWTVFFSPHLSRAASGSLLLKISAQGHHKEGDVMTALIDFYNGPNKTSTEPRVLFAYQGSTYQASVALPADFRYEDRYALFIKPEKYTGRVFCNPQLGGTNCTVPGFSFLKSGSTIDLSSFIFYAGDIPPMNGKVDAADISFVMRDLGKIASGEASTDVNNDKITDIVDYSLTLFSLAAQAKDDTVNLTYPPANLSPTQAATASPTFSLYPSETPIPTATTVPTATTIPTATPVPATPTQTPTPKPTNTPTPTPIPRLGKNCSNGTSKVTQSINKSWDLNVLAIPYGHSQYVCVNASMVVLHWSDSPNFSGNSATWGALNSKNVVCGLAIDDKQTLQMSNFYDDKVTWEGCSTADNSINIEINGTQFDLWYDKSCNVVNPTANNALASGELQQKKQAVATQYGISTSVLDWENPRYVDIMKAQEKKVLDAVRYLLMYYDIPKDQVTGHFKLTSSKVDPGPRFLDCIKKKL